MSWVGRRRIRGGVSSENPRRSAIIRSATREKALGSLGGIGGSWQTMQILPRMARIHTNNTVVP